MGAQTSKTVPRKTSFVWNVIHISSIAYFPLLIYSLDARTLYAFCAENKRERANKNRSHSTFESSVFDLFMFKLMHERRTEQQQKMVMPPHNALSSGTFDVFVHVNKQYWPGKLKRSAHQRTRERASERANVSTRMLCLCSYVSLFWVVRLMKRRVNTKRVM